MNSRERIEKTLRFEEPDRPPHFEMMFEMSEEAFGLSFPSLDDISRSTGKQREIIFEKCAEIYEKIINRFGWDAVCVWYPQAGLTSMPEFTEFLRKYLSDDKLVIPSVWHCAICLETVSDYMQFSIDLMEEPEKIHEQARKLCDRAKEDCKQHIEAGCDMILLPCDSGFNAGPFLSPMHFREFVAPYIKEIVDFVHKFGLKVIFHTDGNIMSILDQIIDTGADVLQSIDPMAEMDIREVKKLTYGKIALMGNVKCCLLQDGPVDKIIDSAEYALKYGAPGGGFIYSSSNTIFKGLPIENYDIMLDCLYKYA